MKYSNPKATAGCIIYKGNKVLLTKRNVSPFKNYWCLPGGHIEYYEPLTKAVKREVKEEIGLNIKPKFFTISEEIIKNLNWHAVVIVFTSKFYGKLKIDKNEVSDIKFFSKKEIKNLKLAFKHKEILNKFF